MNYDNDDIAFLEKQARNFKRNRSHEIDKLKEERREKIRVARYERNSCPYEFEEYENF